MAAHERAKNLLLSLALHIIIGVSLIILVGAVPCLAQDVLQERPRRIAAKVTVDVDLRAPADAQSVRLWIPFPLTDPYQTIDHVTVEGNYSSRAITDTAAGGGGAMYLEWNEPRPSRQVTFSFTVRRREQTAEDLLEQTPPAPTARLGVESACSSTERLRSCAATITTGMTDVVEKARAVYDWIIAEMKRDPSVKGCGPGDVERLLEVRAGKCADFHSLFVALARAAGLEAREIFGIRIPSGLRGDMTKAQHCWAEFFLPGHGWIPVDPSDVRKAMLDRNLSIEDAAPLRHYFFGAIDARRIAFGPGRNVILAPAQSSEPLNYFMYPYAEADGKPLNEDLYGFNIGYEIRFEELEINEASTTVNAVFAVPPHG